MLIKDVVYRNSIRLLNWKSLSNSTYVDGAVDLTACAISWGSSCCTHLCWFRVLNPGMLQCHPRLLFWVSVSPFIGWCSISHPCWQIELCFLHLLLVHIILLIWVILVEGLNKCTHVGGDVDPLQDALVASQSFSGFVAVVGQLEAILKKWMLIHQ